MNILIIKIQVYSQLQSQQYTTITVYAYSCPYHFLFLLLASALRAPAVYGCRTSFAACPAEIISCTAPNISVTFPNSDDDSFSITIPWHIHFNRKRIDSKDFENRTCEILLRATLEGCWRQIVAAVTSTQETSEYVAFTNICAAPLNQNSKLR